MTVHRQNLRVIYQILDEIWDLRYVAGDDWKDQNDCNWPLDPSDSPLLSILYMADRCAMLTTQIQRS